MAWNQQHTSQVSIHIAFELSLGQEEHDIKGSGKVVVVVIVHIYVRVGKYAEE